MDQVEALAQEEGRQRNRVLGRRRPRRQDHMAKAVLIALPKARTEGDQRDVRMPPELARQLIGVSFTAAQQVDGIGGVSRKDEGDPHSVISLPLWEGWGPPFLGRGSRLSCGP